MGSGAPMTVPFATDFPARREEERDVEQEAVPREAGGAGGRRNSFAACMKITTMRIAPIHRR